MFYWIVFKKGKQYIEEQYYPDSDLRMLRSIKTHCMDGWRVVELKLMNRRGK